MERNNEGECLVEHHLHYKEIDGYDETTWMTKKEHGELHRKLRKEGKCNIPVEKLKKIVNAAHQRTEKSKKYRKEWKQKNPEKVQKTHAKWAAENPDRNKIFREKNPNYGSEWRKKNPNYGSEYYYRKKAERKRNGSI